MAYNNLIRKRNTNMSETLEKIKEIVAKQLEVDPSKVVPEANFMKDLEADSLDVVELVMKFETEFDIDIDDQVASQIETVHLNLRIHSPQIKTKVSGIFGKYLHLPGPLISRT